jgi:hypothetical protein
VHEKEKTVWIRLPANPGASTRFYVFPCLFLM